MIRSSSNIAAHRGHVIESCLSLSELVSLCCIQDAMEQREHAQKAALEALRNASATDNVVRIYKYV